MQARHGGGLCYCQVQYSKHHTFHSICLLRRAPPWSVEQWHFAHSLLGSCTSFQQVCLIPPWSGCEVFSFTNKDVSLQVCQSSLSTGIACKRGSRQCPRHGAFNGAVLGGPHSVSAWSSPRLNLFGVAEGWWKHLGSMHQNLYAIYFIAFQLLKAFKGFWFCFSEAWGRQYLKISFCLTTRENTSENSVQLRASLLSPSCVDVSYSSSKHAVSWDIGIKLTFMLFTKSQASEDEDKTHRYMDTRESRLSVIWGFLLIEDRL